MKSIDSALRSKIQTYIKNQADISELIKGYDLSNEDFTGAVINELWYSGETIQNSNFTRAIIGQAEKKIYLDNARLLNCSFIRTQFPGWVQCRSMRAENCNFKGAFMAYFDYKYAHFEKCVWCDTIFSIGTERGTGATFSSDFFRELSKQWGIEVKRKE